MKDRVLLDEQRQDRLQDGLDVLREQKLAEARVEYENGELDDWIQDDADPADTCKIALATLNWLDTFLAGKYDTHEAALIGLNKYLTDAPLAIKDFRTLVESVIDQRADILAQEG